MEILNKDLSLLISINDDIAAIKDKQNLFITIAEKLHDFYRLNVAGLALLDKEKRNIGFTIARFAKNGKITESLVWHQSFSVNTVPFDLPLKQPKLTFADVKYFNLIKPLEDGQNLFAETSENSGIHQLMLLPMKTGGDFIGYLIFSPDEYSIKEDGYDYTIKIANLIGSAIHNVRAFEELQHKEKEKEMQIKLLLDLVTIKEKDVLFTKLAGQINELIPCEYIAVYSRQSSQSLSTTVSLYKELTSGDFKIIPHTRSIDLSVQAITTKIKEKEGKNYLEISDDSFDTLCKQLSPLKQLRDKNSIRSLLVLKYSYEKLGELNLILGRSNPFSITNLKEKIDLLFSQISSNYFTSKEAELGLNILPQLGLILANLYAFEEIKILTKRLEQEKNYLLEEINLTNSFQEIIGNSQPIINSLNKVQQVAPLDATVLILGETGTGKELIAKAVHNLSKRNENAFITVNCAALPLQLIESELFGHEKGSYTGAVDKRIGRFEVADGGTIFLDEIGELPLEIQSKLLRVLQEKEFERLGGKSTIHSDVRIIAATNRDLEKEVQLGRFRADLYFRLNVFPITVPTLRERADDIPLLVKYCINNFSKKIGREVKSIGKNDMDILMQYNWPGNIRELEHVIERAIIISEGTNLNFENLLNSGIKNTNKNIESFQTLIENEKEHIINALRICDGKVTGENSAAQLLGINGKTLGSRMRKYGIKRQVNFSK